VEAVVVAVRQPAAVPETVDDPRLDRAEHRKILEIAAHRPIGGVGSKERAMRCGQNKFAGPAVDRNDPGGRHRAQPFADITLVEPGACCQLVAGQRPPALHRAEQPRAVADRDHQPGHTVVDHRDQPFCERFFLGIERLRFNCIGHEVHIAAHGVFLSPWVR
jgi:hypothetical protein